MTDINKKSIFALFAVALMVFSACAALATCVTPTTADSVNATNETITITHDGSNWVLSNPSSATGIQIDGDTLKLNNFKYEFQSTTEGQIKVISISGSSNKTSLTIEYTGDNSINCNTNNTKTTLYGIFTNGVNLTFKGANAESKLAINVINTDGNAIGIGGPNGGKSNISLVNANGMSVTANGDTAYAIKTEGEVAIDNSKNVSIACNGSTLCCIKSSKLSISNGSTVIVTSTGTFTIYGIRVSDLSIINSQLNCTASGNELAIAIITNGIPTINNSTTTFIGEGSAESSEIKWDASKFTNVITKASTKMNGSDAQTIIGEFTEIYKYVKTTPGTATTYTVSFDINGGKGTTPAPQTYTEGNKGITLPDSTGFSKDNATFKGWSADGGKTILKAGTEYKPTSNVTLKAQWESNSSGGGGSDNTTLIICAVLAIIILVGCGAYAYYKKFKQ